MTGWPAAGRLGRPGRLGLGIYPDPLFTDLIDAVRATALDLGIEPHDVRSPADADGLDRLLLVGYPGRYRGFLGPGAPTAPPRIIWTGEPLPAAPTGSGSVQRASRVSRALRVARPIGAGLRRLPLPVSIDRRLVAIASDRLTRANLDDLEMAAAGGAAIVVTSGDRGALLAACGLPATVVPFGYHELHAGPLTPAGHGPRDVPLLILGSRAAHTRRARLIDEMQRTGASVGLQVVEGVWGEERASLLRRTRVLVDVQRIPGNFAGMRLLLAIAAGTALVTEPMTDPSPFIPGVHYLEAPSDRLLGVASELAADDRRRAALVDAGQALLRHELTMRGSLERVLAAAPAS